MGAWRRSDPTRRYGWKDAALARASEDIEALNAWGLVSTNQRT